ARKRVGERQPPVGHARRHQKQGSGTHVRDLVGILHLAAPAAKRDFVVGPPGKRHRGHPAQRLGVKATATPSAKASNAEQARLVDEFAGSWQSDEDGTELARQIREARYFRDRDVEL
nr:hypothetical protein [Tanacetum cinerariifolium]